MNTNNIESAKVFDTDSVLAENDADIYLFGVERS
jgi:hypothetical protein